jgi:hypothetical protein
MVAKKASSKSQSKKASPKSQAKKASSKSQSKKASPKRHSKVLRRALIGAGVTAGLLATAVIGSKIVASRSKTSKPPLLNRVKREPFPREESSGSFTILEAIKREELEKEARKRDAEKILKYFKTKDLEREARKREERKREELEREAQKREELEREAQKREAERQTAILRREQWEREVQKREEAFKKDKWGRKQKEKWKREETIKNYFKDVLKSGLEIHVNMIQRISSKLLPNLPTELQLMILEKMEILGRGLTCATTEHMYQICKRYFPQWGKKLNLFVSTRLKQFIQPGLYPTLMGNLVRDKDINVFKTIDDYISFSLMANYIVKHPCSVKIDNPSLLNANIMGEFNLHEKIKIISSLFLSGKYK